VWTTDGKGQRSYIGRPHVGTCQRNPLAKLGSINIQYKPQVRGEAHWARPRLGFTTSLGLIGLSAEGMSKDCQWPNATPKERMNEQGAYKSSLTNFQISRRILQMENETKYKLY